MKKFIFLYLLACSAPVLLNGQYAGITVNSQTVTKNLHAIASDNDGNMIVTGGFYTTITIGGTTLTNSNPASYESNASFIAKMTSAGTYTWVKQIVINKPPTKNICGTLYSGAKIIAVSTDASGNIYLTGSFYGSVSFGSSTLLTAQRSGGACASYDVNIFTAKLSPAGNFLWAKQEGIVTNHTQDWGNSVTTDASGNVYTTGRMIQKEVKTFECYPGCGSSAGSSLCPGYQLYAYLVKYNASGSKIWEKKYANNLTTCENNMEGTSITSDGNHIYLTGHFLGTVNFGNGYTFTASTSNLFLLKLDGSGNIVWANKVNTNQAYRSGLLLDNNGQDIYVNGLFNGTSSFDNITLTSTNTNKFLAKYSSSIGICSWAVNAGAGAPYFEYTVRETFKHPNGNIGIIASDAGMPLTIKEFSTNGIFQSSTIATNVNSTDRIKDIMSIPGGFIYSQNLKGSYDMESSPIASTQSPTSGYRDMMLVRYTYVPPSLKYYKGKEVAKIMNMEILQVEINNNPTHDQFIFSIRSDNDNVPVSIRILNLDGRIIETAELNPYESTISLGAKLQAGIYYAVITQGENRYTEKLLKLR